MRLAANDGARPRERAQLFPARGRRIGRDVRGLASRGDVRARRCDRLHQCVPVQDARPGRGRRGLPGCDRGGSPASHRRQWIVGRTICARRRRRLLHRKRASGRDRNANGHGDELQFHGHRHCRLSGNRAEQFRRAAGLRRHDRQYVGDRSGGAQRELRHGRSSAPPITPAMA